MANIKFFNITSHDLTADQKADAIARFQVDEFVELPADLKKEWGNVDPHGTYTNDVKLVSKIQDFIGQERNTGVAMIMGEIGTCFLLIKRLLAYKPVITVVPIYSTTARCMSEEVQKDGSIKKTSVFKHVQFKEFG